MFNIFKNNKHSGYSFEWPWPDDSNEYEGRLINSRNSPLIN